jgi:hypothetical protein
VEFGLDVSVFGAAALELFDATRMFVFGMTGVPLFLQAVSPMSGTLEKAL